MAVANFITNLSYEGHPESKERFTIPRYSLITIQKFNIKVLAHTTFVYYSTKSPLILRHLYLGTSLCIHSPYHVAADRILQIFIICEAFTSKVLHFLETVRSPTVPGLDSTEDALRRPNGIFQEARLVSAGQYEDVNCIAKEQFHARACLFGKITQDLIGLQKTNNISQLTVGVILNRYKHGHSYLCTYHVTRSDVQLQEAIFSITLNTRNK